MKKVCRSVGIIFLAMVIGFVFASCGNPAGGGDSKGSGDAPPTDGRLTITGLEDYNGAYIYAEGRTDSVFIFASADVNFSMERITGARISNGSVTLSVWEFIFNEEDEPTGFKSYSGSDKNAEFVFIIFESADISASDPYSAVPLAQGEITTANFTDGVASVTVPYIIPRVNVTLNNSIEGYVQAYHDDEDDEGYIEISFYDHTLAIEGEEQDYEQDFELYVNGSLVPFSETMELNFTSDDIEFEYSSADLLTIGEENEIQIVYTANPERPIKAWIPEGYDVYGDPLPPDNDAYIILNDFSIEETVVVGDW